MHSRTIKEYAVNYFDGAMLQSIRLSAKIATVCGNYLTTRPTSISLYISKKIMNRQKSVVFQNNQTSDLQGFVLTLFAWEQTSECTNTVI